MSLANLTNLTSLNLENNSISDIAPLVANTDLRAGNTVNVRENPLSYSSIHTHIPTLQKRGVEVNFDNRIPTVLLKISGVIKDLDNLLVVEVGDGERQPFEGVPVTFAIASGDGTLSATSTTTNQNGQAESLFTLGANGKTNTVRASVEGISQIVTFSDVSEPEVNIPDPNLRERIEAKFGKQPGAPITESEMATLIYLEADLVDISDLAGLEFATNLTELWLGENEISNISVLSGLTNLTVLDLSGNSISDLSPLVANIGLYEVDVRENPVNDTSITIHIPALQSRGVEVFFNNPTPQTLLKISGDNQKIASSVALATPFVVEVQDQNGAAFKGAPVRFAVTSGGGTLSVENAETDANGRAQSTLTLGTDVGKNTVEVTVEDIQQTQIFTANAVNN